MTIFARLFPLIVMLSDIIMITSAPMEEHTAAIHAVPPGVSLAPIVDRNNANFYNISPFLTNTLLQAIAEESEHKRRVQRYRDIEK